MTQPHALFPSLGPVVAAALFHGLDGAPPPPPEAAAWEAETSALMQQRLASLALAAARAHDVALPPAVESVLRERQSIESANVMKIEAIAAEAIAALDVTGIACVVTKGLGMARFYPSVAHRPFTDVDVLVAPSRFRAARATLERLGYREPVSLLQPRDYFTRWCREAINLSRSDYASIDLHHRIPPWVWGARLDFERVRAAAETVESIRGPIPVAGRVHNLLIASLHVVSDKSRPGRSLMVWRDVLTMASVCDPAEVAREARATKLDWLLSFILRQLPPWSQPETLLAALGSPVPSAVDAWRLHRLLPPGLGSKMLAHAFRIPAPNAIAYLIGYALPSRTFLRKEYGAEASYVRWWRDAAKGVWSTMEH